MRELRAFAVRGSGPRDLRPLITTNQSYNIMAGHIDIGLRGEALVADYLAARGWRIVEMRWRDHAHGGIRTDVDIIAVSPDGVYHFVEVKTRTYTNNTGTDLSPEAALTPAKARRMAGAAERYMVLRNLSGEIVLDLAAVILDDCGDRLEIRYYPDVVR